MGDGWLRSENNELRCVPSLVHRPLRPQNRSPPAEPANCPQFPPPLMSPPAPAPLPVPVSPPPLSASGPSPLPGDQGALSGSQDAPMMMMMMSFYLCSLAPCPPDHVPCDQNTTGLPEQWPRTQGTGRPGQVGRCTVGR